MEELESCNWPCLRHWRLHWLISQILVLSKSSSWTSKSMAIILCSNNRLIGSFGLERTLETESNQEQCQVQCFQAPQMGIHFPSSFVLTRDLGVSSLWGMVIRPQPCSRQPQCFEVLVWLGFWSMWWFDVLDMLPRAVVTFPSLRDWRAQGYGLVVALACRVNSWAWS